MMMKLNLYEEMFDVILLLLTNGFGNGLWILVMFFCYQCTYPTPHFLVVLLLLLLGSVISRTGRDIALSTRILLRSTPTVLVLLLGELQAREHIKEELELVGGDVQGRLAGVVGEKLNRNVHGGLDGAGEGTLVQPGRPPFGQQGPGRLWYSIYLLISLAVDLDVDGVKGLGHQGSNHTSKHPTEEGDQQCG